MTDIKKLIGALNTGLSVVERVADIPGVSVLPYVSTLKNAIDAIQAAVELGQDVAPYVAAIQQTFSKPEVSPEDLAALDAKIAALRAALHAPLPPKEAGEPE